LLCSPGGPGAAEDIADILGIKAAAAEYKTALVRCLGNRGIATKKLDYRGVPTCAAAAQLFAGQGTCPYGCLGFGDCVKACPYHAIRICEDVAVIHPQKCKGCSVCVAACPKKLIVFVPAETRSVVRCLNGDKGGETRKACANGCIGCARCVKACGFGAVTVENSLARVLSGKCNGCGKCAEVCPAGCISILEIKGQKRNVNIDI
jgi:Na+-translocating ferredoxin:NAD+ oxidoreductase RNF subunit RnfB